MTQDEAHLINRLKVAMLSQTGREMTVDQATKVLRDYREHKAEAFDQGLTPDVLAARKNYALKLKKEKTAELNKKLDEANPNQAN